MAQATDIALRLIEAGRPGEALAWLDKAEGSRATDEDTAIDLRLAALEALGRKDEAQAERWSSFTRSLRVDLLRDQPGYSGLSRLADLAATEQAQGDVAAGPKHRVEQLGSAARAKDCRIGPVEQPGRRAQQRQHVHAVLATVEAAIHLQHHALVEISAGRPHLIEQGSALAGVDQFHTAQRIA